jgi:hypothetical protein
MAPPTFGDFMRIGRNIEIDPYELTVILFFVALIVYMSLGGK